MIIIDQSSGLPLTIDEVFAEALSRLRGAADQHEAAGDEVRAGIIDRCVSELEPLVKDACRIAWGQETEHVAEVRAEIADRLSPPTTEPECPPDCGACDCPAAGPLTYHGLKIVVDEDIPRGDPFVVAHEGDGFVMVGRGGDITARLDDTRMQEAVDRLWARMRDGFAKPPAPRSDSPFVDWLRAHGVIA